MPTYDYECEACEHTFEQFQSMSDKPLKKCPVCGKRKLQRLVGAGAGIIFKGSGFYETDYKRAGQKSQSKGETKIESKTEAKSETASPTKSETKASSSKSD